MHRSSVCVSAWACLAFVVLFFTSTVQGALVGLWTFEGDNPLAETSGAGYFPAVSLKGNATTVNGQLDLNGSGTAASGWAVASGYTGPTITSKTLVSWVTLQGLQNVAKAGSALTLDRIGSDMFDGLIFSEQNDNRWMNGSSGWNRTQQPTCFPAAPAETITGTMVQLAITYEYTGTSTLLITGYRDGVQIGQYTSGTRSSWGTNDAEVFWGIRHGNTGGGGGALDALIQESQIHDVALTQAEIQALTPWHPPVLTLTWAADPAGTLWSTAGNWVENSPPIAGGTLTFAASTKTTVDNDLDPASVWLAGIKFAADADSYTINENTVGSNSIRLRGNIVNESVNDQTINAPLVIEAGNASIDTGWATLTLAGALTSNGGYGLAKTGAGTLILKEAATYAGNTTINAGTLRLSDSGALPSATTVNVNNDAILELNDIDQTVGSLASSAASTVTLGAGTLTTGGNNVSTHIAGAIHGSGGLVKQGTAELFLDGIWSTYTGKTVISGGRVLIKEDTSLGTPPTEPVADQITLDGGTLMNNDSSPILDANRGITLTANGGSIQVGWGLPPYAGRTMTVNGVISGEGGLTLPYDTHPGALILTADNTYSGPTTLNGGVLRAGKIENLGAGTEINFNGGALQWAEGAAEFDPSLRTMNFLAGGGGALDTNGNDVTLANPVGNDGPGGLTKKGAGVLTLAAVNTYQGPTTLNGGLVQVDSLDKLGPNTRINFTGGGLLWPESTPDFDPSVRTLNFQSNQGILDTNGNDATLSQPVGNGGAGGLTKAGLGTLTLTGAQSYSGATNISGGTLKLSPLVPVELPATVAANVLHLDAGDAASYTITDGVATWADNSGSGNNVTQGDVNRQPRLAIGGLSQPTMRFDGNDSLVMAGVGNLPTGNSPRSVVFVAGQRSSGGGAQYAWWWGAHNDNNCFAFDMGGSTRVVGWNQDFPTGLTASPAGDVWSVVYNGGVGAGGDGLVSTYKNGVAGATGVYNYNTGVENLFIGSWTDQVYNLNGDIAEILVYNGVLTAEERQAVEAYLQAKWRTSLPGGTAVNIADGATLDLNGVTQPVGSLAGTVGATVQLGGGNLIVGNANTDCTYSGAITGEGNLVKHGTAALTLEGTASDFTGKTAILGGQLRIAADSSLGAAPESAVADQLTVDGATLAAVNADPVIHENRGIALSANGGRLLASNGTLTVNSVISGAGPLTVSQDGLGTVVLAAANTHAGDTRVTAGTLTIGHSLALQNSTLDMNAVDSGTVDFNGMDATLGGLKGARDLTMPDGKTLTVGANSTDTTYSGTLTGFGSGLTKTGSGMLTLQKAQIYSGPTVIDGGTLKLLPQSLPADSVLWLDAADAGKVHNDGTDHVDVWNDKSLGGAGTMVQGFPDRRPQTGVRDLNGKNVLTFDGANDGLAGGPVLAAGDDDYTYFAVWRPDESRLQVVIEQNSSPGVGSQRSAILAATDWGGRYGLNGEGNDRHDLVPYTPGQWRVTSLEVNNALFDGTNNIRVMDGADGGALTQFLGRTGDPGALNVGATGFAVGYKLPANAEYLKGDIAELLVFPRVLDVADRDLVLTYLNSKWFGTGPGIATSNLLPPGTVLSLPAATAVLDLNGVSQEVAALSGVTGAEVKLGGATLTVSGTESPGEFAGSITGEGSLLKTGEGTLVLGGENTFVGSTTVTGGTLEVANPLALPAGASLTIGGGGTVILQSGLGAGQAGSAASHAAAVPEPGTLVLLLAAALGGVLAWRRRSGTV